MFEIFKNNLKSMFGDVGSNRGDRVEPIGTLGHAMHVPKGLELLLMDFNCMILTW